MGWDLVLIELGILSLIVIWRDWKGEVGRLIGEYRWV